MAEGVGSASSRSAAPRAPSIILKFTSREGMAISFLLSSCQRKKIQPASFFIFSKRAKWLKDGEKVISNAEIFIWKCDQMDSFARLASSILKGALEHTPGELGAVPFVTRKPSDAGGDVLSGNFFEFFNRFPFYKVR